MKNRGVILEPVHRGDSLFLGSEGSAPDILESADWEPFLPEFEAQSKFGLESMNCVQFSLANVCEIQARFYGKNLNLSDRFLYWSCGCTSRGNTFSAADYGFRAAGGPNENRWPWTGPLTREQYGMEPPQDVQDEAKRLWEAWQIGRRVYVTLDLASLKAALKKGPLWACNSLHAFVIYKIDDRLRVWDTYGNGLGSFPLEYVNQLEAAYLVPFTPKQTTTMPNVKLENNCLVSGVFPDHIKTALHLDGKLMTDIKAEVLSAWFARNENPVTHRFEGGPVRTLSQKDWESFPLVNMKGEPLP